MEEVFKLVDGWSFYYISNLGSVKSRYRKTEKLLAIKKHYKNGYMMAYFQEKGIKKALLVHRLVAKAFMPNPENKKTVNHKNGIKQDNRLENLEWATQGENNKHAFETGLSKVPKGKKSVFAVSVRQYLGNIFIKQFDVIDDAIKEGFVGCGIYQSISTGCKHHGYNWEYTSKPKINKERKIKKPICRIKDGHVIKIYNSIKEMVSDGFWVGNIYTCLHNKERKYKGFHWKYA